MDRAEFDPSGRQVRILRPGDRPSIGNRLHLVPSQDTQEVEAVRYAFERFDSAHLSFRQLARELQARGYPPPGVAGWQGTTVHKMLLQSAYAGFARRGKLACGTYYQAKGEEIIRCNKTQKRRRHQKPDDDIIAVSNAYEPIIPLSLFRRVAQGEKAGTTRRTIRQMTVTRFPGCCCAGIVDGTCWLEATELRIRREGEFTSTKGMSAEPRHAGGEMGSTIRRAVARPSRLTAPSIGFFTH